MSMNKLKNSSLKMNMNNSVPLDILYNKKYALTLTQNKELLDGILDRSYTISKVYKSDGTSKMMVFNSVFYFVIFLILFRMLLLKNY